MASTAVATLLAGCSASADSDEKIIDKPEFTSATGVFDISALKALGTVGAPIVSPDGSKVLFGISYESLEENRSNMDLYVMNPDGSDIKRITRTSGSESSYCWIDGGKKIAFIYAPDGVAQVWVMNADGSGRKQVTDIEKGVSGFVFSPDETKLLLISNIKYSRDAKDIYPDLPKATGRVIDDLMYKHWDQWGTEIPHPFLADFDGAKATNVIDIMADEPRYESPMLPFGGIESFAWAPDSKSLVYTSRKKEGKEYAISTNSDLYLYTIADGSTRNLTEGMMGYDTNPVFSPDGSTLAWLSMEHDGYESDKNRIFTLDMASGTKTDLTADWDYSVNEIAWNPDGKSLCFIAPKDGVSPMFTISTESREVSEIANGVCDYAGLNIAGDGTVFTRRHAMTYPNEICRVANGEVKQLTNVNTELLGSLKMPTVEKKMVPTTDGKEMLVWVVYPPEFDPNKKYPALLICQGGPQQAVSQFWSSRWNFALMASNDYIV
ncbi:MAG: peptidase S9, partial [Duncaniella sp.]|nr:peptidase S9 [Duncaniella sp.]